MKRYYFLLVLLLFAFQGEAQISVFDCDLYAKHLTQAQMNASSQINGTCIVIGDNGAVQLKNNKNVTVTATNEILLTGNVVFGNFSEDGEVHLKTTGLPGFAKSPFDVVVMNYSTLDGVLRYKKLELGVEIPLEVLERINHFLQEKGVYSDELNPFLEWQVDVEATFEHVATGKTVKVDGFYTREYVENPITDDWDDVGTNYPFRIRFAPPNNGEWRGSVALRLKNGQETGYQSSDFLFKVVESGDPGYVKVHENKRNLKHGNRMIVPIGVNFPYPMMAVYSGAEHTFIDSTHILVGNDTVYYGHSLKQGSFNSEKSSNIVHWKYYLDQISDYLNLDRYYDEKRYIRTMQYPASSLIEFEEKGNYYKRLHYAYEQDKLLDTLEKYNALMQFGFMNQEVLQQHDDYGAWDWDWSWDMYDYDGSFIQIDTASVPPPPRYCYNDKPSGQKQPYEAFSNDNDLLYHKQRIRYYMARYGYSTKIMEFEILSEPFHLNERPAVKDQNNNILMPMVRPFDNTAHPLHVPVRQAVVKYHRVLSEYLRDSLRINQLIGADMGWSPTDDIETAKLPLIDIIGMNKYVSAPDDIYKVGEFINKLDFELALAMSRKPILFSEGGLEEVLQDCSNYTQHTVDMMSLPFTGIAGFFAWVGWRKGTEQTLPMTIRAQRHFNGNDVIGTLSQGGGNWKWGQQEARLKKGFLGLGATQKLAEHQYFKSLNKTMTVGYVRNRSYNMRTKGCIESDFGTDLNNLWIIQIDDLKQANKFIVEALQKKTKYYVDWYSFKDGNYLKTDYLKTNMDGDLKLDFPTLSAYNPVVWYVVHQNAYSGMIQNEVPLVTEERVNFNFQSIENDTTNVLFTNSIYPNPFQNIIMVNSLEDDILYVKTLEGKITEERSVKKGVNEIKLDNLSVGLYFFELKKQRFSVKIEKI